MNELKIFISGSIRIKKLPQSAIIKINNIIDKNFQIIIGDAKGVDSLVQKYLLEENFQNVIVYYAGDKVRNNLGNWPIKNVSNNSTKKGRDLYTLKDIQMANDADYGLMIWDGESKGTLANIKEMKIKNKRFFVFYKDNCILDKDIDSFIQSKTTEIDTKQIQPVLF